MSTYPSEETLKKLWRSKMTILEILRDRKYPIKDSDFMEYKDFIKLTENFDDELKFRKDMTLHYEKSVNNKIMVIWPEKDKLGTNIRDIVIEIESFDVSRAIIVINDSVTNWGKSLIRHLHSEQKYIDVYTLDETQYNIVNHILVPKHRICSKKEKAKIMLSYSAKPEKIPQIKSVDPMVRHLGAKKGQLLEITRDSDTQSGHKTITWRIVS